MKIAYLDTETSHLSPDKAELLEICIITEIDGQIIETFHTKIKPEPERMAMANPISLQINGYDPDLWTDAPTWRQVATSVASRLQHCTIVGHNVGFDLRHIEAAMQRAGDVWRLSGKVIDTVSLCREHLPMASVKMDNIRFFFGWSTVGAHGALVDTRQTRRLFHKVFRATVADRLLWWLVWQWKKNTRPD